MLCFQIHLESRTTVGGFVTFKKFSRGEPNPCIRYWKAVVVHEQEQANDSLYVITMGHKKHKNVVTPSRRNLPFCSDKAWPLRAGINRSFFLTWAAWHVSLLHGLGRRTGSRLCTWTFAISSLCDKLWNTELLCSTGDTIPMRQLLLVAEETNEPILSPLFLFFSIWRYM